MTENARKKPTPPPVGRLAAVVHAVVRRTGPAPSYADLKADVCDEVARLRIPYDAGTLTAAIALVERTRPVLSSLVPRLNGRETDGGTSAAAGSSRGMSDVDARAVLARLGVRL